MSSTLVLGLTLQAFAVGLLLAVFRSDAFRRAGFYFVALAFAYHGVTEIVQRFTTVSRYRAYVQQEDVDDWTLLLGAALVVYSLVYLACSGRDRSQPDRSDALIGLNWRVLALLCVPLVFAAGRGDYANSVANTGTSSGLTTQFLILLVALTTVTFIATSHRPRAVVLAITAQTLVLSLAGSRQELVVGVASTLLGLLLLRVRISARQLLGALLVVAAFALALNVTRAQVGRERYNSAPSAMARVQLIGTGLASAARGNASQITENNRDPLGQRLDGNSFPTAVMQGLAMTEAVGFHTLINDLRLAIPSALDPGKRSSDVTERSEKAYIAKRFGYLEVGDFLPTHMGVTVAFFGPWGVPIFAALFAMALAAVDRLVRRRITAARLVLVVAVTGAVFSYEQNLDVYPVNLRGALLIMIPLILLRRARLDALRVTTLLLDRLAPRSRGPLRSVGSSRR